MELRNYQIDAKNKIYSAFRNGVQNVMLQLPTGAGKTILFSAIIKDGFQLGRKILVLAHRAELIDQAYKKLYHNYGIQAGIIKSGINPDVFNPVQIASVQTMVNRKLFRPVDIVITDECFPSNTVVDNKPISELKIGDYITAFDENNKKFVKSKILNIFKKQAPNILYKITAANNASIICTEDHPIFTTEGWVTAKSLKLNQLIGMNNGNNSKVHNLQPSYCKYNKTSKICLQENKSDILLGKMRKKKLFNKNVEHKQSICFRKNENQQPYEKGRNKGKGQQVIDCYEMGTKNKGRQWASNRSTNIACERHSVRYGICRQNKNEKDKPRTLPNLLQIRYSKRTDKIRNRSRRQLAFCFSKKSTRYKERNIVGFVRVDDIEIYEQGNYEQFAGLCPDGFVYNIEVEKYHTYIANGIIVHNCHHQQSGNTYGKIKDYVLSLNPNTKFLGVTATPCRTNGSGFKGVYDELIQGVSITYLIKEKHLAPPRYYVAPLHLENVKLSAGDYNLKQLSEEYQNKVHAKDLVHNWQKLANNLKTIGFAVDVEHSKSIVEAYKDKGIAAAHIDGTTKDSVREQTIKDFQSGKITVLYNVGVFDEGFDLPEIEAVQLARPTKSLIKYMQMVGRALRPAHGKNFAVVLDHGGLVAEHDIVETERIWTLNGVQKKATDKELMFKDKLTGKIYKPQEIPFEIPMDRIELIEYKYNPEYLEKAKLQKIDKKYNQLQYIAQKRNFSGKWIWYKFISDIKPDKDKQKTEKEVKIYADFYTEKMGFKSGYSHFLTKEFITNNYSN